MTTTVQQPTLTQSERTYLAQLQRDVDLFRQRLREFERITTDSTHDSYIRSAFQTVRGNILLEIEQRRRDWIRFAVLDSRDDWKRDLLNTEV